LIKNITTKSIIGYRLKRTRIYWKCETKSPKHTKTWKLQFI